MSTTKFTEMHGNEIGDLPPTDIYVDLLFNGVGASADGEDEKVCPPGEAGSKHCIITVPSKKTACEKRDGKIKGKGPNCEKDEEQAGWDVTRCYYEKGLICIRELAYKTQGSGSGSGGCCQMVLEAYKKLCDVDFQQACLQAGTDVMDACIATFDDPPVQCQDTPGRKIKDPEKCRQDDCAKQGANAQQACLESVFIPARRCYDEAARNYKRCTKLIPNQCDCSNCQWEFVDPCGNCDDKDEETNSEPIDDDTDPFDPLKSSRFETSSSFGVIPRVFGRYVVPGNVIWIGNQRDETITYTQDLDGGEVETVTEIVTKLDFCIGLCIGPTDELLRMWSDKVLIYNTSIDIDESGNVGLNGNDGSIDIDLTVLAEDDYNMQRLVAFKPTIEFYRGGATQKIVETMVNAEGFGNVPAHRGLTLVMLRDIDLRLLGDNFPELHFDVASSVASDVLPHNISATIPDLDATYLEIDTRTETAYVRVNDEVRLLNANTMAAEYTADVPSATSQMIARSGYVAYFDGSDLRINYPFKNYDRAVIEGLNGAPMAGADAFITIDDALRPYDALLIPEADGALQFVKFYYTTDMGELLDLTYPGVVDFFLVDSWITTITGSVYDYQFLLADTTDGISVRQIRLTENGALTEDLILTTTVLDTALWGDATDIENVRIARDATDNTVIVFVRTTASGNFYFKLDTALAVVWSAATVVNLPTWSTLGEIRSRLATPNFSFVDADNDVIQVDLATGELTLLDNVTDHSYPSLGGPQFYDGKNDSIVYMTNNEKLVRIFLNRRVPNRVAISDVVHGLISQTRLDPFLIDTTDVEDVTFEGYLIDTKVTFADVMSQLGELYLFSATDNGNKLSILKDTTIYADVVTIDYNMKDTLNRSRAITGDYLTEASAKFHNIDWTGLIEIIQVVTIKPDDEKTEVVSAAQININLNEEPAIVRIALERVLQARIADADTLSLQLFPRSLSICPRDTIMFDDKIYRVRTCDIGPGGQLSLHATRFDEQLIETDTSLTANPLYNALNVVRPVRKPPYRPVILFTNSLTDDDVALCADSNKQVVYTGIDAPNREIEGASAFRFRMMPGGATPTVVTNSIDGSQIGQDTPIGIILQPADNGSPFYMTESHTEGVHVGIVKALPGSVGGALPYGNPVQFVTDNERITQTLVVEFDHVDTAALFVNNLARYAVLETPLTNLLIVGREYLQFDRFTVAGDNRTVTFTRMYRGKQGTEPYIETHFIGEKVYFYTPETFERRVINPQFTARQQTYFAVQTGPSPAGVHMLAYGSRSDAGSARQWGPADVKLFDVNGDGSGVYRVRVRHRRQYKTDLFLTGGWLPFDYSDNQNPADAEYTVMVFRTGFSSFEDFEERIIRNFDEAAAEDDLVFGTNVQGAGSDPVDPDIEFVVLDGINYDVTADEIMAIPVGHPDPDYPLFVCIMPIRNNLILGHPTFRRFPAVSPLGYPGLLSSGPCEVGTEPYDTCLAAGYAFGFAQGLFDCENSNPFGTSLDGGTAEDTPFPSDACCVSTFQTDLVDGYIAGFNSC